jgi:hypothetical protein
VNEIVFHTSFSESLVFVYGKATEFYKLILYPVTLLRVFIGSKSLLVVCLVSFKYSIISSVNRDNVISSFSIHINPCVSFSCLIALAKISRPSRISVLQDCSQESERAFDTLASFGPCMIFISI